MEMTSGRTPLSAIGAPALPRRPWTYHPTPLQKRAKAGRELVAQGLLDHELALSLVVWPPLPE